MLEFLGTPAGIAVFCVVAVALALLIIELNYKYFTKLALDFIFALVATVVCCVALAVCAALSKRRSAQGEVFERRAYLGYKGKIVVLHAFAGLNGRVRYLARLFDILGGRLSFVGVKPLPVEDGALLSDEQLARFAARPGIFTHLSIGGGEDLTYEEMFALDVRYARRRELFYDFAILIRHAVLALRGEGTSYLGETAGEGYCAHLLARGEISAEEAESARANAADALADAEKEKQFKKERLSRR